MKISTQTRYAMRLWVELSPHESNNSVNEKNLTLREIADRQGISKKYLESIASKLKKGGIILSSKGVNGGYRLARATSDIFLGDIMKLMETAYFIIHCVDNPRLCCPNYDSCVLANFWLSLECSISVIIVISTFSKFLCTTIKNGNR